MRLFENPGVRLFERSVVSSVTTKVRIFRVFLSRQRPPRFSWKTAKNGKKRKFHLRDGLIERDLSTLKSCTNELSQATSSDKRALRDKFATLSTLASPHVVALAIEFGEKDELVLCNGINIERFRAVIECARSISSVSSTSIINYYQLTL